MFLENVYTGKTLMDNADISLKIQKDKIEL